MPEEELVDVYTSGGMSRRAFVRRLVAAGVGLTAAVELAGVLAPAAAQAAETAKQTKAAPPRETTKGKDQYS